MRRRLPAPALRLPPWHRAAPTLLAAALGLAYVLISPGSLDLAAHLLRAKLFAAEGFGLWNNWWYAGHHVPGYSVLFPPVAALLTPQLAGALAAVATVPLFELLAHEHFGRRAWLGTLWFGAATAVDLFTGRLAFAFGLLPAVATALALQRRRAGLACGLAVLTALASPVAALFAALAGAACALGGLIAERNLRVFAQGALTGIAALIPVAVLAVAFPEGGTEPFALSSMWPVALVAVVAVLTLPRDEWVLRVGVLLYLAGVLASYLIPSPVGGNAQRLGALLAGPLAALIWWQRRTAWLALAALPLLYLQWQPPVRDVSTAAGDPTGGASYWQPLLDFLSRQPGAPFRVEIPFTQFHMEAYRVAPRFPSARGWERQVDIEDNPVFYDGTLNARTYLAWLHRMAIRFVAVSDAPLDYAGRAEQALIRRGLPYLQPVMRSRHWQVLSVSGARPLASGAARVQAVGPNSLSLSLGRPGDTLLRVHFTPYWQLSGATGCVFPEGGFTGLRTRSAGPARLVISFSMNRIAARSPRCAGTGSGLSHR